MTEPASPFDPLKAVWLSQTVEPTQMTAVDLSTAATGFERKVRRRNRIEYVAGGVACFGFAWTALTGRHGWIVLTGDAVMVLGVIFALWQLHRRSSPARAPAGGTTESLLDFQRIALARQRDALKAVPVWYLLPFAPGFVLLGVGHLLQEPNRHLSFQQNLAMMLVGWLIIALLFLAIWLANAWVAEKLDRAVEKIDAMRRE